MSPLFLRRGGALAIDAATVFALEFFVTIGIAIIAPRGVTVAMVEERLRWPIAAAYFIGFWTSGGTPGMRQMRLVIERPSGGRPTLIESGVRFGVLGGIAALAAATVLVLVIPYAVVCAFGFYAHDVIAGTVVRRATSETAGAARAISRSAYALGLLLFGVMVAGVVLAVVTGGIPDPAR